MVILTNKMELSTYDWVSLGINIFFVGFFIWNANSNSNNKQILSNGKILSTCKRNWF